MGQGAVVVGLERVVVYIVAEQKIKTWTPISCALAMQPLAQKMGVLIFRFGVASK